MKAEAAEDTTDFAEKNNKQKDAQIRAAVAENADRTVSLITGANIDIKNFSTVYCAPICLAAG